MLHVFGLQSSTHTQITQIALLFFVVNRCIVYESILWSECHIHFVVNWILIFVAEHRVLMVSLVNWPKVMILLWAQQVGAS